MIFRTRTNVNKSIRELLEVIPDAAVIINTSGTIALANHMLTQMFGYKSNTQLIGQSINKLVPSDVRDKHDNHIASFFAAPQTRPMNTGLKLQGERADGSRFFIEIMLSHVELDQPYAIAFVRDATPNILLEERIRRELENERQLALTDHLTGLQNRRSFVKVLNDEIERLKRDGVEFAVCFIDLDDFKQVNDTLGHAKGDKVLQYISNSLKTNCRGSDFVARIGGDEFATIHPGTNLADALAVLGRVRESIVADLDKQELPVTMSMGVCHCDDAEKVYTVSEILSAADDAMYEAKRRGKNQIQIASLVCTNKKEQLV